MSRLSTTVRYSMVKDILKINTEVDKYESNKRRVHSANNELLWLILLINLGCRDPMVMFLFSNFPNHHFHLHNHSQPLFLGNHHPMKTITLQFLSKF